MASASAGARYSFSDRCDCWPFRSHPVQGSEAVDVAGGTLGRPRVATRWMATKDGATSEGGPQDVLVAGAAEGAGCSEGGSGFPKGRLCGTAAQHGRRVIAKANPFMPEGSVQTKYCKSPLAAAPLPGGPGVCHGLCPCRWTTLSEFIIFSSQYSVHVPRPRDRDPSATGQPQRTAGRAGSRVRRAASCVHVLHARSHRTRQCVPRESLQSGCIS